MKSSWKVLLGLAIVGLCGAIGFLVVGGGAAEAETRQALEKMQVLVTPDASGKHVQGIALLGATAVDMNEVLKLAGGLPYLEVVRLAGTGVKDADLAHLGDCRSITTLDLSNTTIGDSGLKSLEGLPNLITLYLSKSKVSAEGLKSIGKFSSLKILNLSNTAVTGDLSALVGLDELEHLMLAGVAIDEQAAASLAEMNNLSRLTVEAELMSEGGLKLLQAANGSLQVDLGASEPKEVAPAEVEETEAEE